MQKEFSILSNHNQLETILLDVKLKFTRSEVEEYLTKMGYELKEYKNNIWVSAGPHDSYGRVVSTKYQCAVVPGDTAGLHNLYMDVFESITNQKLKKLILE